jgi:hypothetical protein
MTQAVECLLASVKSQYCLERERKRERQTDRHRYRDREKERKIFLKNEIHLSPLVEAVTLVISALRQRNSKFQA